MRRAFNGWCHGLFAGQYFERVLNLGCGHDYDKQGYMYSGYFDSKTVIRVDIIDATCYPDYEAALCGRNEIQFPVDILTKAEDLTMLQKESFDMVFCNWVIYHCDYVKVVDEVKRLLKPNGKFYVSFHCDKDKTDIHDCLVNNFTLLAEAKLNMDKELDGMDWLAEALWLEKK